MYTVYLLHNQTGFKELLDNTIEDPELIDELKEFIKSDTNDDNFDTTYSFIVEQN